MVFYEKDKIDIKRKTPKHLLECCGDPKENRTPDAALRGQRLNRLTIGPSL